ncbi:MAG TPA: hypothetical protein DCP50_03385, partial [Exiguobacterium sp.]|nr:hypothetical protein [Exiguobacterium sp.]
VADQGRITINGNVAKASSTVAAGDEMTIRFGNKIVTVAISSIKEHAKKEEASDMYEIIREEKVNSEESM